MNRRIVTRLVLIVLLLALLAVPILGAAGSGSVLAGAAGLSTLWQGKDTPSGPIAIACNDPGGGSGGCCC